MSHLVGGLLLLLTVMVTLPDAAHARYAAIVMDSRTGEVLYARNADDRLYPASLTKIMTLYMTFDALKRGKLRLDQKLPVSARAAGQTPTKLGLKKGDRITVQDAMFGLITKSANDAATVLAESMAESEAAFARDMTEKAKRLGMRRTSFRNASGLPNRGQKSTARDMAILGAALIHDFPQYYHFLSLEEFDYKGKAFKNHNNLLKKYKGADGIKTGYIRASGFNLVASAKRGSNRLVGVVFGGRSAKSRDIHMAALLDKGFSQIEQIHPSVVPLPLDRPQQIALGTSHSQPAEIKVASAAPAPLPVVKELAATSSSPVRSVDVVKGARADPSAYKMDQTGKTDWAIQIGAYSLMTTARDQVYKAAAQAGSILVGRRVNIEKAISDGKPFYRAQLTGFEEAEAREACSNLAERRFSCFVVAPDLRLPNYIAQNSNS
ncbi:D-alanyl-D-alanine carboxypeptidase [uncultured Sneathiella sp.]|uniref:D-alanyl-D-alanine carboxypeptidase n=1 Tax=uncultured Sneathiella sp. TaxID=879315 RepID=UPI00259870DB|nr:D-alanyl-D-alanine carboxypeptidase [uncultured Sneathiella sp.]